MEEWWALAIAALGVIGMLLMLAFKSEIKIGKIHLETFWMPPFLSALILLIFGLLSPAYFWSKLTEQSAINPLQILVLFISMTFLSIVLDEAGFFAFLASKAVRLAKGSQFGLFSILYALTSFLTIFTSNDIIILTFTPFLVFFSKSAKVNPIPYLVGEFVAANTWSLLFLIGNPTNIYLGASFSLSFTSYFLAMWPSTVMAGVVSYFIMILLFIKALREPLSLQVEEAPIKDRFLLISSLSCLSVCIVLLVISSFLNLPMWIIAGASALALLLLAGVYSLLHHEKAPYLGHSLARLPYTIIPFILAMFALVMALKENGLTTQIASLLSGADEVWGYGFSSLLVCNLINNIPMSVLYTEVIRDGGGSLRSVYASIIGSNIGAFLSPVGALAGVMWMSILKRHGIRFTFFDFVKYGVLIAIPSMAAALSGLYLFA
jgi:arsenical pump membrane protein